MTVRLRKLPKVVIALLSLCVLLVWLIFLAGPLYNLATHQIAFGRVVHADSSSSSVLIKENIYPFSNDCVDVWVSGSCRLKEGDTGLFLITTPNQTGFRLDQIALSISFSLLGTLVFVGFALDVRIRRPQSAIHHHHH